MSEWWTYRPSDFLMFAPRTYWRLFELQNTAWWPVHLLALGVAVLCIGWCARRPLQDGGRPLRVATGGLAALWAFVAVTFLLGRYAPINWAATTFAAAFCVGAAGLALLATQPGLRLRSSARARGVAGMLLIVALIGYPIITRLFGRPWAQAELFGLAPDPTVVGTLGMLIGVSASGALSTWLLRGLQALALAWCLVSVATLATMQAAQAWWLGGVLLVGLAAWSVPTRGR